MTDIIEPCPYCRKIPVITEKPDKATVECKTKRCHFPIICIGRNRQDAIKFWNDYVKGH